MRKLLALALWLIAAPVLAQEAIIGSGVSGGTSGVKTTWDPLNVGNNIFLSGGNLTANASTIVGVAIDLTNSKFWYYSPVTARWNAAAIGSQNPGTATGGFSYVIAGAMFPAWSGFRNGGGTDTSTANFGATAFKYTIPSGYSSWDALAGTPTTWNPSDKSANIALSNGNLTATDNTTSSTWRAVRATNGLSAGKAYYEIQINAFSTNGIIWGFGNASMSLASFVGGDAFSFGWQQTTGNNYVASVNIRTLDTDDYGVTPTWTSGIATKSRSSGKYCWEFAASAATSGTMLGIANGSASRTNFLGVDNNSAGWQVQNGHFYLNGDQGAILDGLSGTGMACIDFTASKIWFYSPGSGQWNKGAIGSQNPATNTGGISIAALGTPIFPALAFAASQGETNVSNFGATAFSNSVPSGFAAWGP